MSKYKFMKLSHYSNQVTTGKFQAMPHSVIENQQFDYIVYVVGYVSERMLPDHQFNSVYDGNTYDEYCGNVTITLHIDLTFKASKARHYEWYYTYLRKIILLDEINFKTRDFILKWRLHFNSIANWIWKHTHKGENLYFQFWITSRVNVLLNISHRLIYESTVFDKLVKAIYIYIYMYSYTCVRICN